MTEICRDYKDKPNKTKKTLLKNFAKNTNFDGFANE